MSYPKHLQVTITLTEDTHEALLICRLLDGMSVEAVLELALKNYLEARRGSTDFKAVLGVKKHHSAEAQARKIVQREGWTESVLEGAEE